MYDCMHVMPLALRKRVLVAPAMGVPIEASTDFATNEKMFMTCLEISSG